MQNPGQCIQFLLETSLMLSIVNLQTDRQPKHSSADGKP